MGGKKNYARNGVREFYEILKFPGNRPSPKGGQGRENDEEEYKFETSALRRSTKGRVFVVGVEGR